MYLTLVTGPATSPVTVADVKAKARIDYADEDALVQAYIDAATTYLDGASGLLGRAIVTQTWKLTLPRFPTSEQVAAFSEDPLWFRRCSQPAIKLPLPPLQSISSVQYYDGAGVLQTLGPGNYQVYGKDPAYLAPSSTAVTWPTTQIGNLNAVQISFVCGYGAAATVPASLQLAIVLLASHWFDQRAPVEKVEFYEVPFSVKMLIRQWQASLAA